MSDITYFAGKDTDVRSILADALNKADHWQTVVLITENADGDICIGHSDAQSTHKVGMCAIAMDNFIQETRVDE